jgi:hypothetical protein
MIIKYKDFSTNPIEREKIIVNLDNLIKDNQGKIDLSKEIIYQLKENL